MIWWPWRSSTRCFSVPDQRTSSSSHSTTWMQSETLSKALPAFWTRLMRRTKSSSRYCPGSESWLSDRLLHRSWISRCPRKQTRGEMAVVWNGDHRNAFLSYSYVILTLWNRELVLHNFASWEHENWKWFAMVDSADVCTDVKWGFSVNSPNSLDLLSRHAYQGE